MMKNDDEGTLRGLLLETGAFSAFVGRFFQQRVPPSF